MNRRHFFLSSALFILPSAIVGLGHAQVNPLPPVTTITFPAGQNTSTVTGEAPPGGRNAYYVQAKAGQTLMVSVGEAAAGITFQVFKADATLARGADGQPVVTGGTLPDAGPKDQVRAWIGAVPDDGNYLILVTMSGAAGGQPGGYSLTVSLL